MARLLPEVRSGSNKMGRWLVTPPCGVTRERLDELRSFGVLVATP